MSREEVMSNLCRHLYEDMYGDPEEYFNENNIDFVQIDSYVNDADSKGFSQHCIYEVKTEEPFYFIYEWYGGRWESESPRVYFAEPKQVIRFEPTSEDLRDKFYDDSWESDQDE